MTASPTNDLDETTLAQNQNLPILIVGGRREDLSVESESECIQLNSLDTTDPCPEINLQEPVWLATGNVLVKDGQHYPVVCGGLTSSNLPSNRQTNLCLNPRLTLLPVNYLLMYVADALSLAKKSHLSR